MGNYVEVRWEMLLPICSFSHNFQTFPILPIISRWKTFHMLKYGKWLEIMGCYGFHHMEYFFWGYHVTKRDSFFFTTDKSMRYINSDG